MEGPSSTVLPKHCPSKTSWSLGPSCLSHLSFTGKGDLIGADIPEPGQEPSSGAGPSSVLKTSADVKALTYCGLQQLSGRGLAEVLRLYPEYAAAFRAGLLRDLTFNLRQGSDSSVRGAQFTAAPLRRASSTPSPRNSRLSTAGNPSHASLPALCPPVQWHCPMAISLARDFLSPPLPVSPAHVP